MSFYLPTYPWILLKRGTSRFLSTQFARQLERGKSTQVGARDIRLESWHCSLLPHSSFGVLLSLLCPDFFFPPSIPIIPLWPHLWKSHFSFQLKQNASPSLNLFSCCIAATGLFTQTSSSFMLASQSLASNFFFKGPILIYRKKIQSYLPFCKTHFPTMFSTVTKLFRTKVGNQWPSGQIWSASSFCQA